LTYIKSMPRPRQFLLFMTLLTGALSCGGESTPPKVLTTVTVAVSPAAIQVGQTATASASGIDQNGASITLGAITWSSSNPTIASVSPSGAITALSAGTVQIIATTGGKVGQASLTVTAATPQCASPISLNPGDIRPVTSAEAAALCLGGLTTASEYVLIPFNSSPVPSSTTQIQLDATNTVAVQTVPSLGVIDVGLLAAQRPEPSESRRTEARFRTREVQDIGALRSRQRVSRVSAIPGDLTVGSIIQLNSNLTGNTCSSARVDHPARLVAVLPHTMVFIDTLAPAGGYSDAELIGFAESFDAIAYGIDTLNFGAPTDIDENGRVVVFFTPGINSIPAPSGGFVGGLFSARDLFSVAPTMGCVASNEGEMFYMPVPDPSSTINGNYTNKTALGRIAVSTLAHEFQHLINASRRIYVNNAQSLEVVWLNEGLSHIAEELLYYRIAGNGPFQNLTLQQVAATQTLVDAFNQNMAQNFGRLRSYLAAPSSNSPFSTVDGLETRGAIWQLMRYSSDQKGGDERQTWLALVNTTATGQANFNAVLGDIISRTRDWAVAQFVDDAGLSPPARYTHPSWNFRSILPAVSNNVFPIATSQLIGGVPLPLTLVGGGAAYVRFRIAVNTSATIAATSSGQPVPANMDFILVRTQ
jgi:hypothetical protein